MKIQANHKVIAADANVKTMLKAKDDKSITLVIMPTKSDECAISLQFKSQAELDSFKSAL